MRCRTQCPLCRTETGEAELHFEDPSQAGPTSWCGQGAGRFVDIKRSALHAVMAHGEAAPPELLDLFASVRRQPPVPGKAAVPPVIAEEADE